MSEASLPPQMRSKHVAQMRANFAIEGLLPDCDDLELQRRYVAGEIDLEAMLLHARDFTRTKSSDSN